MRGFDWQFSQPSVFGTTFEVYGASNAYPGSYGEDSDCSEERLSRSTFPSYKEAELEIKAMRMLYEGSLRLILRKV